MEKKVLFTQLDDRGSHLRKQITPTAVVSDEGKYPAGMFWDANKTIKEIVAGASDAQDTLKEIEDKLNGEIGRAKDAEEGLSEKIDDLLGIDAQDIEDLKQIVEDLDPETGILSVIEQNKEDILGKADKSNTVSNVAYNTTNKKITKTINGTTSDVVMVSKLKTDMALTKSDVGLGNVGNFKAVSTVASQGLTTTEKANARANIGAGTSSFSGSYNDLTNKPTIPAAQVNSDWDAASGKAQILNKPELNIEEWNNASEDVAELKQTVEDDELVVASALCDLDGRVIKLTNNNRTVAAALCDLDSRIKELDERLKAMEQQ